MNSGLNKVMFAWLSVALIGTALWGCRHEQPWPGTASERLVIVLSKSLGQLDQRTAHDGTTRKVSRLVYRGLFRVRGSDLAVVPDLAEGLTSDGPLRYCVSLRRDVQFHNGAHLAARDVSYTLQCAMDEANGSSVRGLYLDRFQADRPFDMPDGPNGHRVCFNLRQEVATLRTDLVLGIVPEPVPLEVRNQCSPKTVVTATDKCNRCTCNGDGEWVCTTRVCPGYEPPGTGDFSLFRRDGDRGLILERVGWNDNDAARGVPRYLIFRNLPDENGRLLALVSQDADLVLNGFSPAVLKVLQDVGHLQTLRHPSMVVTYLTMNTTLATLSDRRVRMAIGYAVDRHWITRERFLKGARPANGMLPIGHWARNDAVDPFTDCVHDPQAPETEQCRYKAEKLLEQAGYSRGSDGIRLRLQLLTTNDRIRRLVARDLSRQLALVGIQVRVRSLEWGTMFDSIKKGQYALAILQLPEPIEPDMMRWMFFSLSTPLHQVSNAATSLGRAPRSDLVPGLTSLMFARDPVCRKWAVQHLSSGAREALERQRTGTPRRGGGNRSFFADVEVDCWLDLARRPLDPAVRKPFYDRVQERLAQEVPVLFLWHEDNVAVASNKLSGISMTLRPDLAFLRDVSREP